MNYQPYRNLPALAGIASFTDAMRPGLSVEECVRRLKRYHYALKRLHQIFIGRLTAEPIYELKMGFSLHAHYCAEHVAALRQRIGEMREPPLGLDIVPDSNLEIFFDEILAAPTTGALLWAIYRKAVRHLIEAMEQHRLETNPLADAPTVRLIKFALLELQEMSEYGEQAVEAFCNTEHAWDWDDEWLDRLEGCIFAAGGLDGSETPSGETVERWHSAKPFIFDPVPKRDARFPDPYNMGVNAEVFLYSDEFPPEPKTLMMFYKRLREIDVPEMMASIIAETPGKPWGYYRDMTRQLWDEARHAMMGEVGFVNLGIPWPDKVMVNFTWSLGLNTQLKPIERHAVLYFIEQGLMPKTGKRFEWEVALASHNPLSGLFQDYDWADEVLHARVGRDWYVKEIGDARRAVDYGDECWSKVLMGWSKWRDDGHTQHRNWWPDCYTAACRSWNITPDPKALGFDTNYSEVRADLKNLTASA